MEVKCNHFLISVPARGEWTAPPFDYRTWVWVGHNIRSGDGTERHSCLYGEI